MADSDWTEVEEDLLSRLSPVGPAERELVRRLVWNLRTAQWAHDQAEADPFVPGSTGQVTEHPAFRIAARCDATALRIARDLRLADKRSEDDGEMGELIELARAGEKNRHKRDVS